MTREENQESTPGVKEHKSAVKDVFNTMLETINSNSCKEVINEGGVLSDNDYSHYDNLVENKPSDEKVKAKPDKEAKNLINEHPLSTMNISDNQNGSMEMKQENSSQKEKSVDSKSYASYNSPITHQANMENRRYDNRSRDFKPPIPPFVHNEYTNPGYSRNDYINNRKNNYSNRNQSIQRNNSIYRGDGTFYYEQRNNLYNQRNSTYYDNLANQRGGYNNRNDSYSNQRNDSYGNQRNQRNDGYGNQRNDNYRNQRKEGHGNQRVKNNVLEASQNDPNSNDQEEERGRKPKRQASNQKESQKDNNRRNVKATPAESYIFSPAESQKETPLESEPITPIESLTVDPLQDKDMNVPILTNTPEPSSEISTVMDQLMSWNIKSTATSNYETMVDRTMMINLMVNALSNYDGTINPKTFLNGLDSIYNMNEDNLVDLIQSKLLGLASDWFVVYLHSIANTPFVYLQFRTQFRNHFTPNPIQSLIDLRQNEEDLKPFLFHFRAFVITFNSTLGIGKSLDDWQSFIWLYNALKPQYRSKILDCAGLKDALERLKDYYD